MTLVTSDSHLTDSFHKSHNCVCGYIKQRNSITHPNLESTTVKLTKGVLLNFKAVKCICWHVNWLNWQQTGSVNTPNLKPRPAVMFTWAALRGGKGDAPALVRVNRCCGCGQRIDRPSPRWVSVWLKCLGQVLQQREQLLLLQSRAVGPGQWQVGGHHLAVCAQTQVGS